MDESSLQLVCEIGNQLARLTRFNKGLFLKSLKQAASAFSEIEQPLAPEASTKKNALKKLDAATNPLRKSIIKHGLLQQNDKDVRLFVAICVSEMFRILAPEPPFEDKYLRGIFELIVNIFKELGDTTCPFFSRRVKILETVARCKCFVIMLDIDCNDLIIEMFNNFFSIVSEHHQQNLINDILSIMTHILNEEVTQPLLEVILQNLVKQGKDVPSAASQLAVSVIQSCMEQLEPSVCGFLSSCFLDRDAVGSELKEFYHEIMFEIFRCAPQMLLAIIPNLIQELLVDQVDVRIKAVNLIGNLFALPENHIVEKYHDLFIEFLKRFSDKSAEVRMSVLQCAKAFYLANPIGKESHEVLTALESRLLDFDDRVRMEAVIVACDIARSNLKLVPPKLISEATERIRDKKISVRKKALQKLLEVYRDYCKQCSEGRMTICNHFEQIPCRILMLCYDCKEFRSQSIERVLMDDLFPVLEIEERTRHWVHLFSHFTPLHLKALNSILSQKQRLRTEMQFYLSLRKKEKENHPEETRKRLESSFVKMSVLFPDPSKAKECFLRLNKMKDNNIFNALEELLDQLTIQGSQSAKDKFLKLIGDKHPDFKFLQLLSSKCLYIFDSEHVRCILDDLSSNGFGVKHLEASSVKLLLAIISVFPMLLRGLELQFQKLLEGNDLIDDKLIEVLAKAGPHISVKFCDFNPFLERMCLEGTRAQSKYAVSAIASLSGTSALTVLCKKLVDSLHSGRNISTVLQSLGCIAQYSVSTFETQDEDITPYIYKIVIQVEPSDLLISFNQTSGHGASSKLKVYGMKTLVKSFLPHRGSHVKRKISGLLDILSKMLHKADIFNDLISCESDEAHIRLAAAKSVLRLSRRWDLHICPEIFYSTVVMARDSSMFVRRSFIDKTHKLLKVRVIPIRYACAFALATSDILKDLRDDSFKYMAEFIKEYSKEARIRQNSAVQGVSITDYPAYIVVFLIHVLAHDPGFPPEDCQDKVKIIRFFGPLFSFLQALVNASIVDGDRDIVHDAISCLLCILLAIKKAVDAVDTQKTSNLHILADIGISFLKKLNHNGISSSHFSGLILLPSSLYQISLAKKGEEANSDCISQFNFDQTFVERVVDTFRYHFDPPCHEEGMQLHVTDNRTSNLIASKQFDLPTSEAIKPNKKNARQETSMGCKRKRAVSPIALGTVGLCNKYITTVHNCENGASKSCEVIMEKELRSSCDSVTIGPTHTESQVSSQNMDGSDCSLKENVGPISSDSTEPLKFPSAKFRDPCSGKESSAECEALLGQRNKSVSPTDRRFYSGSVDGLKIQNTSCKITNDSGEVELLSMDSESRDINGDDSLSEREVLLEEEINTIHLQNDSKKKTVDTSGDDASQHPKTLSKQERGKFACRTHRLAAKGKTGQKASKETSTSEVINIDEDVVARRTRRQRKV
ncbi:hypothetical protein Ddye_006023 [Dipteronia dyeriana]|uniref:Sister chromatid cohesion protein PDS5 homolog A n=1 Tax=Dipteronia dyeriana TaxID=168575 RepID=A0AAD9XH87_9ROSI|nr:hypothetical protein Ddye_006023 [Dipteronia dyeriana]